MNAQEVISDHNAAMPHPVQLRMVHWWDKELQCEEDIEKRQYLRALMAAKKVKLCWGLDCSSGRESVLLGQGWCLLAWSCSSWANMPALPVLWLHSCWAWAHLAMLHCRETTWS